MEEALLTQTFGARADQPRSARSCRRRRAFGSVTDPFPFPLRHGRVDPRHQVVGARYIGGIGQVVLREISHFPKAAPLSLTRSFAEELAPHQVLDNALVAPGAWTETAKSRSWLEEWIKTIPVRRSAGDVAEVILFLASKMNRYVMGECVITNGGG